MALEFLKRYIQWVAISIDKNITLKVQNDFYSYHFIMKNNDSLQCFTIFIFYIP